MDKTFGGTLRRLRLAHGHGLRAFAELVGLDPGNLSRMERGQLRPPAEAVIRKLAKAMALSQRDTQALVDLAAAERLEIGAAKPLKGYIRRQGELIPLLLRTVKDKRLTREEIASLIDEINGK